MTLLRKKLIWGFWTKNSPKWIQNESLTKKCCMKHILYFNWSDSIVKALNHLEWIVWGKILFWRFLTKRGPYWTQNEVSSIMKNQYMELSWFFYTTYSCINTYNWIIELNDFFERKIFFDTAQKMTFALRISSVNVTKSAENCGFGHIYWRNP